MERALVARLPGEHALEVRGGPIDVAELLVEEVRGPLGELQLDALGESRRALRRHHGHEHGGEVLRATRLGGERRQPVPQGQVGRELPGRARDDVERPVRIAELRRVHVGEPPVEGEAVVARGGGRDEDFEDLGLTRGGAGLVVRALEDRRRAGARLAHGEQVLDDLDGARVVRRELEGPLGSAERLGVAPQRIDEQFRELDLPRGALEPLALVAVERDDLGGAVGVALGAEQPREGAQRAAVVGDELQHAPVERDGLGGLAEGLLFEDGPLGEELELVRGVRALDAEVEEPAQVVAAIGLAQDAIERLHGEIVVLVLFDELPVHQHRLVDAPHLARVDLGELGPQRAELLAAREVRLGGVVALLALLLLARAGALERLEPCAQRLDEARPLLGGARRDLERGHRPVAARIDLVRLAGPRERRRAVLQAQAGDLNELVEERELLLGRGRPLSFPVQEDLVERRQPAPLLVLLVERGERRGGARVGRAHREDALVRSERALGRVQLLGVDRGAAEAEIDLEAGVRRLVGRAREDLDEPLPVGVLRVELGEALVVADGDVAVAQDAERLRVARLELEDPAPGAHRLLRVAHAVGVDAAQLEQDREARGRIGRERRAALEHVGHRGEVLVALGLLLERVECRRGRRLLLEHALVELDGLRAHVEALAGELRHLHPELAPLGTFGGVLGLAGEQLVERLVGAALGVELLQALDRLAIGAVDGVELLVRLDGVLHVRELIEPAPRDRAPQLRLHAGLGLELRLAGLHREEVAPPLERLVHARELAHAPEVARIELRDLREHGDERRVALHLVAVHDGDLAEHRQAARGVVEGELVELLPEEVGERVPARRLAVEALQRVARVLVLGVLAEDRAPLLDRLLRVRALLGEARDLGDDGAALGPVGRRALRVAEDRHEPGALAARRAPLAEEVEHPGVRRIELAQALEPRLRRVGPAALAPVHHANLEDRARLLVLAAQGAGRELALVEGDEVLPHLVGREVIGQEGRGLRVAGRDVEHALVRRGGAVVGPELLREGAREAQPPGDLLVLLRGLAREALEGDGHVVPAAAVAEHALEEHLGAPVLRIELEGVAEERHDAIDRLPLAVQLPVVNGRCRRIDRSAPVPEDHLGGAHEERAAEGGVAGALGLLDVAVEEVAPLGALRVRALEGVRRVRVVRVAGEDALVGAARAHVVHQLFVEDARELHHEGALARRVARGEELDLEHPSNRVVLPAPLVRAPRGLEEARELVGAHLRLALDVSPEPLPRLGAVGVVLQQPEGALDRLRAHPSPGGCRLWPQGSQASSRVKSP